MDFCTAIKDVVLLQTVNRMADSVLLLFQHQQIVCPAIRIRIMNADSQLSAFVRENKTARVCATLIAPFEYQRLAAPKQRQF
jgi:hypothetical protein